MNHCVYSEAKLWDITTCYSIELYTCTHIPISIVDVHLSWMVTGHINVEQTIP